MFPFIISGCWSLIQKLTVYSSAFSLINGCHPQKCSINPAAGFTVLLLKPYLLQFCFDLQVQVHLSYLASLFQFYQVTAFMATVSHLLVL